MKKIISIIVIALVLFACGKNTNKSLSEYVTAFVNENKSVTLFGKADVNTILDKASYSSIPKLGVLVKSELEGLKSKLNTETPIYFAFEGPFDKDGTPNSTYLFAEVKNIDSLEAEFTRRGFDMTKEGDLIFHESGDVVFGAQNNLLILISKKADFEGQKLITEAFDKVYNDATNPKVKSILSQKGELVVGCSIENLFATSNTSLNKVDKTKREKLDKMVKDSYVQSVLKLEKGYAELKTEHLFSKELAKEMFFNSDANASILSKLGTGTPRLGLSTNVDVEKMQSFLDEYAPGALNDLVSKGGGPFEFALMAAGEKGLAGLFSGEIGVAVLGEPGAEGAFTPNFNIYVGLEENGKSIADAFSGFLKSGMAQVNVDENGLSAYSNALYVPQVGKTIQTPEGCAVFGKKGVTIFANLEGLNVEQFDLEDGLEVLNIVKYFTVEMDNNGSRIYLKAKDDNANFMKQVTDFFIKKFEGKIEEISF